MFLNALRQTLARRIVLPLMLLLFCSGQLAGAAAAAAGGKGDGITWKICESPPICFTSAEARQAYAKEKQCQFLEDVCEKTPPKDDDKGANPGDEGFWGSLWGSIKDGLVYGYEFVKGLLTGLKEQVTDLVSLVGNLDQAVGGLVQLGKAFFDDPKGTLAMLAELLGQEAVDTITRATQCGAYDLGKVIGGYVDPVVAIKLATTLTKYSGKLADVVKATKHQYGCASFGAGTPVLTPAGYVPIESIVSGQLVASRGEGSYADAAQPVTHVFGRVAPSYRELRTETETYRLTDEHPLWVQGRGWTEAKDIGDDDVIAGRDGDTRVLANEAVPQPLRVYNFSVGQTPSYFVGKDALWAHNASCSIELYTKAFDKLSSGEKGFRGEWKVFKELDAKGYKPVKGSFNPTGLDPEDAYKAWHGQTGIDGIYVDAKGNYVIVESKATGGTKSSDPEGCKGGLCLMKNGDRQMSAAWLETRLEKLVADADDRKKIIDGLLAKDGTVKKVYASTDANGTIYHDIIDINTKDVKIGGVWTP